MNLTFNRAGLNRPKRQSGHIVRLDYTYVGNSPKNLQSKWGILYKIGSSA